MVSIFFAAQKKEYGRGGKEVNGNWEGLNEKILFPFKCEDKKKKRGRYIVNHLNSHALSLNAKSKSEELKAPLIPPLAGLPFYSF